MTVGHLAAFAVVAPLAHAGEAEEVEAGEIVTVVATRTERPVDEVAATVGVATAEQIEKQLVRNIADLARFEPGVARGAAAADRQLAVR